MVRFCPDCPDTMLSPASVESVQLDVCPKCAGVWFDDGELRRVSESMSLETVEDKFAAPLEKPQSEPGPRRCPGCSVPMEEYRYMYNSPVSLDSCPLCHGIWVQDGELLAMSRFVAEKQQDPVDPAMHSRLVVAEEMVKHDERVARTKQLQRVMGVLSLRRRYPFGWH